MRKTTIQVPTILRDALTSHAFDEKEFFDNSGNNHGGDISGGDWLELQRAWTTFYNDMCARSKPPSSE